MTNVKTLMFVKVVTIATLKILLNTKNLALNVAQARKENANGNFSEPQTFDKIHDFCNFHFFAFHNFGINSSLEV